MTVESLVQSANNSIGESYCADVCGSHCCKSAVIVFPEQHAALITQGQLDRITKRTGGYCYMPTGPDGCPSLDQDNSCIIYGKEGRPKCCSKYPLELIDEDGQKRVILHPCQAVSDGLLEEHMKKIRASGTNIEPDLTALSFPQEADE